MLNYQLRAYIVTSRAQLRALITIAVLCTAGWPGFLAAADRDLLLVQNGTGSGGCYFGECQPTQQRQAPTYGKRLTKNMLIDSRESRAGGIRFFDPLIDTVIVNNKIFRADPQLRLPGTYVFRLDRSQQRLRLACALSDQIRRNARYALRVIRDNNLAFEQNYSIGSDPISKDINIAGAETLVFEIAGSPIGDFMLFYCDDELVY